MLFNSYDFLFLFLFPALILLGIFRHLKVQTYYIVWYLSIASIIFYAQWSLEHLTILIGSVIFNYIFAHFLYKEKNKLLLFIIIGLNLLPLVYYKYSNFLTLTNHSIVLPLAISFFTFQQIAFQVDLYKEKIKLSSFREYLFFVLFFPQLIAGPIVHYNDLLSQVNNVLSKFSFHYFNQGIVLFSIGLFKKVALGDNLALIANSAFSNTTLTFYEAWLGILAYSFQIYFDFSGYADMAIGLALMFGITLPINFNSPYKSKNIIDFWRRWHITLSTFLKEHIYIPLGGNRLGSLRAFTNVLITMLIGGVWHGAGWTFLIWGFFHGLFLGIVHLYKGFLPKYLSISLTFLTVTLLWVLFRAESFDMAINYYKVLLNFSNEISPVQINVQNILLVGVSWFIVWFLPNSLEFSKYNTKGFTLQLKHSFLAATLFAISLKLMAEAPAQTFVYFNF